MVELVVLAAHPHQEQYLEAHHQEQLTTQTQAALDIRLRLFMRAAAEVLVHLVHQLLRLLLVLVVPAYLHPLSDRQLIMVLAAVVPEARMALLVLSAVAVLVDRGRQETQPILLMAIAQVPQLQVAWLTPAVEAVEQLVRLLVRVAQALLF